MVCLAALGGLGVVLGAEGGGAGFGAEGGPVFGGAAGFPGRARNIGQNMLNGTTPPTCPVKHGTPPGFFATPGFGEVGGGGEGGAEVMWEGRDRHCEVAPSPSVQSGGHPGAGVVNDVPEAVDLATIEDLKRGEWIEVFVGLVHPRGDVLGGHEFDERLVEAVEFVEADEDGTVGRMAFFPKDKRAWRVVEEFGRHLNLLKFKAVLQPVDLGDPGMAHAAFCGGAHGERCPRWHVSLEIYVRLVALQSSAYSTPRNHYRQAGVEYQGSMRNFALTFSLWRTR